VAVEQNEAVEVALEEQVVVVVVRRRTRVSSA
jgi:hypothetical protein